MFKTKEFKIITTFIFLLFAIALSIKFYFYNRIEYSTYLKKEIMSGENLMCINEETQEAYKTENNNYELIKVKTSCFNNISEISIYFPEKNKTYNILDCHLIKKIK